MCEIRHERAVIDFLLNDVFATAGVADAARVTQMCIERLELHYGGDCPPECLERCAQTYLQARLPEVDSRS